MKLHQQVSAILGMLLASTLLLSMARIVAAGPIAASAPAVRLASLEWEPYIGTRMPDQGYVAVLIRAAFADQGMQVEIEFYPWARALSLARSGAVDGLMPEYFNPSRESEFEYSSAFPGGPLVLYKRRGDRIAFSVDPVTDPDAALRALQANRFGVVRGYLNTPEFDAATYLTKDEANDDASNLRKLVSGRIDLAVIDRRVAEHLMRTDYPDFASKIEPMAPALAEVPLYIAFSRMSPRKAEALAAFNRGLAAMRADGRLDALHQRYIVNPSGTPESSIGDPQHLICSVHDACGCSDSSMPMSAEKSRLPTARSCQPPRGGSFSHSASSPLDRAPAAATSLELALAEIALEIVPVDRAAASDAAHARLRFPINLADCFGR